MLDIYKIPYSVPAAIGAGTAGLLRELVQREIKILAIGFKFKPDFIIGTSVHAARISRLIGSKSIVLCEDDAHAVPIQRLLAYPLATAVVTPDSLKYENYGDKHLTYPSYQKLFYLHPDRFIPDDSVRNELGIIGAEQYAIIRLSALKAHHDRGVTGITKELLHRVIELAGSSVRLFISSEKELDREFEPYRLTLPPEKIHHALAFAEFFLGDSQSMTMEAALLGTPSFRINSFVGKLSVLKELEDYGLSYGFRPGQEHGLLNALQQFLATDNRNRLYKKLWEKMISDKIDPLPWFLDVINLLYSGKKTKDIKEIQL